MWKGTRVCVLHGHCHNPLSCGITHLSGGPQLPYQVSQEVSGTLLLVSNPIIVAGHLYTLFGTMHLNTWYTGLSSPQS